ncbi:unnamed protein product [Adineta ricciae]|uniref:G-protein coupled receptors family 1 profile domain-containing protein n=1 Tax=Adineta ricciae TaxID=249248 RepID=A0A814VUV7_ADIRI|nr:unnamed protein product [Adineta ricciae]CAF1190274.1 unnamed protein product [Adineta ricciae]
MSSTSLTYILSNIQLQLERYVYSLWIILGVPGCILDIMIFSRQRLRKISCCNYFLAASINNLVTLFVGVLPVMYSIDHPDLLTTSLWFCKIRGYLFQICLMLSRWFVAFACIDRYALKFDQFWTIICSHRMIFYEIKGNICGIITNTGAALYHSLYVLMGGGVLPAATMITCALLIRRNLRFKRQRRQNDTVADTEHQRQQSSLDQQVLKLLFIQSFFYILLTTPQLINLIYSTISSTIPNRTTDRLAIDKIIAFLAELMLYVFPVASFYLYTLTARAFQQELVKIFRLIFNRLTGRRPIQVRSLDHTISTHNRQEPTMHLSPVRNLTENQHQ